MRCSACRSDAFLMLQPLIWLYRCSHCVVTPSHRCGESMVAESEGAVEGEPVVPSLPRSQGPEAFEILVCALFCKILYDIEGFFLIFHTPPLFDRTLPPSSTLSREHAIIELCRRCATCTLFEHPPRSADRPSFNNSRSSPAFFQLLQHSTRLQDPQDIEIEGVTSRKRWSMRSETAASTANRQGGYTFTCPVQ